MGRRACGWVIWAAAVTACSPALDWRAVRPEESGAVALFPCRPASHARRLHLGDANAEMFIYACTASGATFALGYADVADPLQVGPALAALRTAAIANMNGSAQPDGVLNVTGMTPNDEAPTPAHRRAFARRPGGTDGRRLLRQGHAGVPGQRDIARHARRRGGEHLLCRSRGAIVIASQSA